MSPVETRLVIGGAWGHSPLGVGEMNHFTHDRHSTHRESRMPEVGKYVRHQILLLACLRHTIPLNSILKYDGLGGVGSHA